MSECNCRTTYKINEEPEQYICLDCRHKAEIGSKEVEVHLWMSKLKEERAKVQELEAQLVRKTDELKATRITVLEEALDKAIEDKATLLESESVKIVSMSNEIEKLEKKLRRVTESSKKDKDLLLKRIEVLGKSNVELEKALDISEWARHDQH